MSRRLIFPAVALFAFVVGRFTLHAEDFHRDEVGYHAEMTSSSRGWRRTLRLRWASAG